MSELPIIVLLLLLAVFLVPMQRVSSRQKIRKQFSSRPPLTPKEFAIEFFPPEQKEIAEKVMGVFQRQFPLDLSGIRPDDAFGKELKLLFDLYSTADIEILMRLEETFGIIIEDPEAEKIMTLREMVDLVSKKLEA